MKKQKLTIIGSLSIALTLFGPMAVADPICHIRGNGDFIQIDVNANALTAHYKHGDWATMTLYADNDGDGLGDPNSPIESCEEPLDGFVQNSQDVDDTVPCIPQMPSDKTIGVDDCGVL